MAKTDSGFGNARYTADEEKWLRQVADALDFSNSELVRKCLALGIPLLLHNEFVRRVELKDAMGDWKPSVNSL